jgi:hypothetical protein
MVSTTGLTFWESAGTVTGLKLTNDRPIIARLKKTICLFIQKKLSEKPELSSKIRIPVYFSVKELGIRILYFEFQSSSEGASIIMAATINFSDIFTTLNFYLSDQLT